jgi:hypothetical protein
MDSPAQEMAQAQIQKWNLMGAEPIYARRSVRLAEFKKDFTGDQPVMVEDPDTGEKSPFMLRSGRPLLCREVLPERADLALTKAGVLLDQVRFEANYKVWLESWVYPPDCEPALEPVPNVKSFINAKPDEWGESFGFVEIDYDAKPDKPFVPQQLYGPNGETEEEYLKNNPHLAEQRETVEDLKQLIAMMAKAQLGQVDVEEAKTEPKVVDIQPKKRGPGRPRKKPEGDDAA